MTFRLSPANGVDLGRVIGLVEEAAAWLRAKGTDQWARPWPSRGERDERIRADILARKTWIAWDGDIAAATITVEDRPDEILRRDWDEARATYVHRLVVSRNYAGISLGAALLNWAGRRAAAEGAVWVRIDVWRTNQALHEYYKDQGFRHVRPCSDPDYPSGTLFQRATTVVPEVNENLLEEEETPFNRSTPGNGTSPGAPIARNYAARPGYGSTRDGVVSPARIT